MPLLKEFFFVGNIPNKKIKSVLFLFTGILGTFVILFAFTKNTPQPYYVAGSSLLLLTAIYFQLTYFIALELILLSGHGAILLGIGPILQVVLPIMLSAQLLVYYLLSGQLQSIFHFIGIIGIALLSIGFSYANTWIFFFGSLAIAIFAFHNVYQGKKIALLWALLNTIFTIVTGCMLLNIWRS